eukprot:4447-Lingulodinium_polyedra.AAC.1
MVLQRPQSGQEQYWLAFTQGEMMPAEVEAQLGARLRTMVRASQVLAFNPHANKEEEAVLLRLPP